MNEEKFYYEGNAYIFRNENGRWSVLDIEGEELIILYDVQFVPSKPMLTLLMGAWRQGWGVGRVAGYTDCQYDLRRALGIT